MYREIYLTDRQTDRQTGDLILFREQRNMWQYYWLLYACV